MFGPKLDAKSYTTFLLIVIGVLLSINLFAQIGAPRTEERFDSTAVWREVANSNAAVASATDRVAVSNQSIAEAIRELAAAVNGKRALDVNVTMAEDGQAAVTTTAPADADAELEPEAGEPVAPVIRVRP
jgi:cytoskeletal protein RodZ